MVIKFCSSSISNTSANIPQPKFCKIISSPHEFRHLRIPEEFARRYCKNMLNPVYLEVACGKVWKVEVKHSEGLIWLAQGWKDFSDYYSIHYGHILIFEYNALSHFNVNIFDLSSTEIKYPTTEIDSNDSIDISDMVGHSTKNLNHGPLVKERKRRRQEGEAEDDIPINQQDYLIEEEESQRNVVLQDQENEEADRESKEDGSKKSSWYSLVNLNGDDPYYEIVVKKTHTTSMTIPMRFSKRTGIIDMKKMRLVTKKGKYWGVEIVHVGSRVIMKNGWAEFRTHNKIDSGETCRFKLIRGHAPSNILQVEKIPTPHSLQYY